MSTTDATGTIIGLKKKVRNRLLQGMRHSSSSASPRLSTTARGTAMAENMAVLPAAVRKEEFPSTALKLSRKTNSGFRGLRMME